MKFICFFRNPWSKKKQGSRFGGLIGPNCHPPNCHVTVIKEPPSSPIKVPEESLRLPRGGWGKPRWNFWNQKSQKESMEEDWILESSLLKKKSKQTFQFSHRQFSLSSVTFPEKCPMSSRIPHIGRRPFFSGLGNHSCCFHQERPHHHDLVTPTQLTELLLTRLVSTPGASSIAWEE